jgi:hypothetical protein
VVSLGHEVLAVADVLEVEKIREMGGVLPLTEN